MKKKEIVKREGGRKRERLHNRVKRQFLVSSDVRSRKSAQIVVLQQSVIKKVKDYSY